MRIVTALASTILLLAASTVFAECLPEKIPATPDAKILASKLREAQKTNADLVFSTIFAAAAPQVDVIHHPPIASDGNHDGKKLALHVKNVFAALHKAMPDFHAEVRCISVNGDHIQMHVHGAGTPPGGKPFEYDQTVQVRVEGGQVARSYGFFADPSTQARFVELIKAGGYK